ncbi:MAG: DUF4352 domain-containing protein [Chloroflexi bacterium]|nr:DUF4352 domain-containing protein [Chloroflexota bacterium]
MGAASRGGRTTVVRGFAFIRIAAAASLALVALAACGPRPDQVAGLLGQPIQGGDYQLTVPSMNNPADPPDRFTNPTPGNRFVQFDVTVANRGGLHLPIAPGYFRLVDSGGLEYAPAPNIPSDDPLRQTSVAPGEDTTAVLYFEMAANQQPVQLEFVPAVFGWTTRIVVQLG